MDALAAAIVRRPVASIQGSGAAWRPEHVRSWRIDGLLHGQTGGFCVPLSFMSSSLNSLGTIAGPYEQDAQHHRAVLNELIDLGTDMARLVHQHSQAQVVTPGDAGETSPAIAGLTIAFDRMVRCVRRTALLAAKLAEPVRVADPARSRVATRQRIIRGVEDAIQFDADGDEAESLHAEFLDRLDSPDLEDNLGDRPVGEIITEICRDLGLDRMLGRHPWARRTPADLIVLRARAEAAPRSGGWAACAGAPVAGGAPPGSDTAVLQPLTRCRDP